MKPRFPDLSVLLKPFVDLSHFFDLERVINFSSLLFLCNQFAFRQYPQMLGNGLSRGVKMLGDRVGGHCLERYQRNDRPPRRVGYGLKNVSSHDLILDYATKRLQIASATERFQKKT